MTIEFLNECQFPVWTAGTQVNGAQLNRGEQSKVQIAANLTEGRFWGRTGCSFGSNCTTGDCEGSLNCAFRLPGLSLKSPATLVWYRLNFESNLDFYAISLTGGFNLPISFIPSNSTCQAIACSSNITANCPAELGISTGGCMSPCNVFNTSQYCCTGDYIGDNCRPSNYSRFFKAQCPHAYTYPTDGNNTFVTCSAGTNYTVVFCPSGLNHQRVGIWIV